MAKTTFGHATPVLPSFLNGLKEIRFTGEDRDFHYPKLGLDSMRLTGPQGFDTRYLTLGTAQPSVSSGNAFASGSPVTGHKTFTGSFHFGWDHTVVDNPANNLLNTPKNFVVNEKYLDAGGEQSPTVSQKFAVLGDADIITKMILSEQLQNLVLDNGYYASASNPGCNNYSINGTSPVVCAP